MPRYPNVPSGFLGSVLVLLVVPVLALQDPNPLPRERLGPPPPQQAGTTAADIWSSYGHSLFGIAVARAGDVDLDGLPDILIANPGLYGDYGIVWVLSGRDGSVLHRVASVEPGDGFGHDVECAGDVDGDGHPDWIVGSRVEKSQGDEPLDPGDSHGPRIEVFQGILRQDPGYAAVFSGRTGERVLYLRGEKRGDLFGYSVGAAGDVDHDGRGDLAVGAPRAGGGAGRVYVHSGKDGRILSTIDGRSSQEHLGGDLCEAGDLDADGFVDLAIARAPGVDSGPSPIARAFSGKSGALLWEVQRAARSSEYGVQVAKARDLDGDGSSDVLIAYSGGVEALSGRKGTLLRGFDGPWSSAYGGGVDLLPEDPIELVAGQPREDTVHLLRLNSADKFRAIDAKSGDLFQFGSSLAVLGDLDGDGRSEFIVGGDNSMAHDPGRALVYSGATLTVLMDISRSGDRIQIKRSR